MPLLKEGLFDTGLVKFIQIHGLDLNYFVKSGLWVSFRYLFVLVTGLVLSIAFARLTSKEFLGQYQSTIAFFGILSFFSLPGLNIVALKSVALGNHYAVIKSVKLSFYSSLIGLPFIVAYAAYSHYSASGDSRFSLAILLVGLFFPIYNAVNTWYTYYEGQEIFRPVAVRIVLTNFILTVSIILALFLNAGLLTVLALYFGISTALNCIFFLEVKRKIESIELKKDEDLDWRLGIDVSFQKLAYSILDNLPVLSVSFLFGFEKLAVFQIAYYFLISTSGFFGGLSSIYLPLLFRDKKIKYNQAILQNLVVGAITYMIFLFLIDWMFIPLFGIKYLDSLTIVKTLAPLIILFPLKIFLFNFLTSRNKSWSVTVAILIASIISLAVLGINLDVIKYLYALNISLLVLLLLAYFRMTRSESASPHSL